MNKTKFSEQCYYIFGEYNGTQIHKGTPCYVNIIIVSWYHCYNHYELIFESGKIYLSNLLVLYLLTSFYLDLGNLSLGDSNSEHGSDMLGPLPSSGSWPNVHERHPYPTYGNMPYNPYHPDGAPNHMPPPMFAGSVHSDVDSK